MKKGRVIKHLAGYLWVAVITIVIALVICFAIKEAFERKIAEVNRWQNQIISSLDRTRTNLAAEALRIAGNRTIIGFLSSENPRNTEIEQVKREFVLQYSGEVGIADVLVIDCSRNVVFSNEAIKKVTIGDYKRGGYDLQTLVDKYGEYGNCFISIKADDGTYKQFYVYKNTGHYLIVFELDSVSIKKLYSNSELGNTNTCIYYNGLEFLYVGNSSWIGVDTYSYMREHKLSYKADQDYISIFFKHDRTTGLSRIDTWEFIREMFVEIRQWILICLVAGLILGWIFWNYLKKMNILNLQQSLEMALMRKKIEEMNQRAALIKGFLGINLLQDEYMVLERYFSVGGSNLEKSAWRCIVLKIPNENTMESLGNYGGIEQLSETICNVSRSFAILEKAGFVSLNHQTLGVVVGGLDMVSEEEILEVLKSVQVKLRRERQVSISMVVSELYYNCDEFLEKMPAVYQMTEYTFYYGMDSILLHKDFEKRDIIPYPVMTERAIFSELERQHTENYKHQIERFLERISQTVPDVARCYLSVLATNIVNYSRLGVNPVDSDIVQQINVCETLEEIRIILNDLVVDGAKKEENKDVEYFRSVSALIEREFSNPDFCLSDVASYLDITASYAGKKFRSSFHQSFNAYLSDFRVSKAVQLLQTTNHKIKEVGELCGFRTTAYFVTVFKKQMGISPQEFRKK